MASRRRRTTKKDESKEAPAKVETVKGLVTGVDTSSTPEGAAMFATPTKPKKTIFSHPSALRCTGPDRSRPAFQQMTCNTPMKPDGTRKAGSRKRWKCPTCGATRVTEGEQI